MTFDRGMLRAAGNPARVIREFSVEDPAWRRVCFRRDGRL